MAGRCDPSQQWGGPVPFIAPRECWGCGTESAALDGGRTTLAIALKLKQPTSKQIGEVLHQYGHKWAAIEKARRCQFYASSKLP
eukprot:7375950-Prymnesium_polylepis.2